MKLTLAALVLFLLAGLAIVALPSVAPAGASNTSPVRAQAQSELPPVAYLPALIRPLQTTLQSPTAGRLLASNCFQCHGTDGKSAGGIDRLAGMSAAEIIDEMQSMRVEPIANNIMKAHARGYTDAELLLIADYFSRQ